MRQPESDHLLDIASENDYQTSIMNTMVDTNEAIDMAVAVADANNGENIHEDEQSNKNPYMNQKQEPPTKILRYDASHRKCGNVEASTKLGSDLNQTKTQRKSLSG